jgi:protein TonB
MSRGFGRTEHAILAAREQVRGMHLGRITRLMPVSGMHVSLPEQLEPAPGKSATESTPPEPQPEPDPLPEPEPLPDPVPEPPIPEPPDRFDPAAISQSVTGGPLKRAQ